MKLDWDDLRVFLRISETGNLSAASRVQNADRLIPPLVPNKASISV